MSRKSFDTLDEAIAWSCPVREPAGALDGPSGRVRPIAVAGPGAWRTTARDPRRRTIRSRRRAILAERPPLVQNRGGNRVHDIQRRGGDVSLRVAIVGSGPAGIYT